MTNKLTKESLQIAVELFRQGLPHDEIKSNAKIRYDTFMCIKNNIDGYAYFVDNFCNVSEESLNKSKKLYLSGDDLGFKNAYFIRLFAKLFCTKEEIAQRQDFMREKNKLAKLSETKQIHIVKKEMFFQDEPNIPEPRCIIYR